MGGISPVKSSDARSGLFSHLAAMEEVVTPQMITDLRQRDIRIGEGFPLMTASGRNLISGNLNR